MSNCIFRGYMSLWILLCLCCPGFAQTVCDFCTCVTDATCTTEGNCANLTGCVSTEFTPPCTQTYTLEVKLTCNSTTGCEDCLACAFIYQGGTFVTNVQAGCIAPGNCTGSTTVTLTGGTSYKLYSCLRACAGNCTPCSECTAKARVYQTVDDCAAPCNW